ncbi:MAG: type IV pilin N-terminal domain-containing protein [Thermoplasmata archaeon]|nr:type IV pilin N-terminal domain-containing protein [Thermoplasmata archaeon]
MSARRRAATARRLHRGRRGVSDVVATILLLALTVVLFSSIFAFVTSFPAPPAQNTSQFSATLVLTANQSYVKGIQITHLAGPSVSGTTSVYFKSATHPQAPEFLNPVAASTGLGGSPTWNLGQTFNFTFPLAQQPVLPDNITVYVTTPDRLLFTTVLPGQQIAVPPNFVSTYVTPANPSVAQGFTVFATALGNLNGASVFVNLANIPGLAGMFAAPQRMTYVPATNQWTFVVPASLTTTNGTFFAFVNVTGILSQTATAAVAIPIEAGGSSSSLFSVAVVLTPQPPSFPATSSYFAAVVSYYGSTPNVPVAVTFWANQTPGSTPSGKWAAATQSFGTASGLKISGPSTLTVYSSSPSTFSAWLFNSSVVVQASATLTGVGSGTGTTTFTSANLVQGDVFSTKTSFAHTCAGVACPFLNATVWDNWSTAITFSGMVYANGSTSKSWTVASTAVAAMGSTTISPPGALTRWKPATAGTYMISAIFTVKAGGVTVGYIFDTFPNVTVT